MKILRTIFSVIWKTYFLLYFVVTLIVLFPLFYVCLLREQWFPYCFKLMRVWGRLLAIGGLIKLRVRSEGKIKIEAPYIICSNHSSYLDIILMYCIIDDYFIFMGKQELSKAPLFNIFFKRMNVLVDRKSKIGSHKAFLKLAEGIDKGHSVAIFPEGTISKEAPRLRPFKNGPFKMAIEKQVPILPVTFLNNYKLLQDAPFLQGQSRPGFADIIIHQPIITKGMNDNDVEKLKNQIADLMNNTLGNYGNRQQND